MNRLNMKYLFFCLLLFTACRDQYAPEFDPYDASQVAGLWYQWPDKSWAWHFSDEGAGDGGKLLTLSMFDFGVEVWTDKRVYWTHGDTLKIQEIPNGQMEIYFVEFKNENEFIMRYGQPIALNYKFIRY